MSETDQTVGPDRLVGLEIGGKYRIVRLLGEGGMGCVYQGEQKLGATIRKVAIKTLHEHLSHDPQILARFEREVGTVAGLQHPNTIQVFDFGKMDDGTLYIVMEFVEGKSVGQLLESGGPMDPPRVTNILKQVCGSLEEAHGLGIVHRDLKPDNIVLCDKAGQHDWVEVLDFGIAKRSSEVDEREQKLTQQGMVLGTPPYMSPEQFTGKPVDRRSDIYSLAIMAYEMLTGGLPFNGNTAWEWATAHMTAQPRPLETFPTSGRIPPAMKGAILRGLEKDPNRRFPTVTEFFAAFSSAEVVAGAYTPGPTQHAMPVAAPPMQQYSTGPQAVSQQQPAGYYPTGSNHAYTPQPFPQTPAPLPQEQKKGGGGGLIIVALLALVVLLGGGGIFLAFNQGWIGKTASVAPPDTNRVASTAPPTVTVTPTATATDTGPLEPLAFDAGKNTQAFVAQPVRHDAGAAPTATVTQPTYTATQPTYTAEPTYTTTQPTYTAPRQNPNEPPECRMARQAYQQGARRPAAMLAQKCIAKGGQPPF